MKIVVDTNIVFSAVISSKGDISDLMLNSSNVFEFFAPDCIIEEIDRNMDKMIRVSGFSTMEIGYLCRILFSKIKLINLDSLRRENWSKAIKLTKDIDEYDAPFIALSLEMEAPLWTGDKKLIKGLKRKNIDWLFSTVQIKNLRDNIK